MGNPVHAESTWTHEDGTLWPQKLLPAKVPRARIMLFAYNANVAFDVSEAGIEQHACTLLDLLQGEREEDASQPIIFIGHSLGGLVIKQALLHAKHNDRVYGPIRENTRAIAFFGTPHRGGNKATLGQLAVNIVTFFIGDSRNDLVGSLARHSAFLARLTADFAHQYEDYNFLSIVETKGLAKAPIRTVVVDRDSSIIGLPGHREHIIELDRNHSTMCKFTDDDDFKHVVRHLIRVANQAIRDSAGQGGKTSTNRKKTIMSQHPSNPPTLISTLDFAERKDFFGQTKIMQRLEAFLDDDDGSYLLLQGPSGIGKSSVAFDFAHRCQNRISVLWISAEDSHIAQGWFNRASYRLNGQKYRSYLRNHVAVVRDWLSDPLNGRWLLVFDNVKSDLSFLKALPWTGRHGKILFTSRQDGLKRHLDIIIETVPPPSTDDTLDIFRTIYGKSNPGDQLHSRNLQQIKPLVEAHQDKPMATVLEASSVRSAPPDSVADYLVTLYDEPPSSMETGKDMDPTIWKWFSIVFSELSSAEATILTIFALMDYTHISEDFTKGICAAIAKDQQSKHDFMRSQTFRVALSKLLSLPLLERNNCPWGQYYCIPMAIRECLILQITQSRDQGPGPAGACCDLLHAAFNVQGIRSFEEFLDATERIAAHCRSLCHSLGKGSINLGGEMADLFKPIAMYFLSRAITEAHRRASNQNWRAWIISHQYPLNDASFTGGPGGDDEFLETDPIPTWIAPERNVFRDKGYICGAIRQSIYDAIWEGFSNSICIVTVGIAWHGIREEIFEVTRTAAAKSRSEDQILQIIDQIDKGACEGLLAAIREIACDNTFKLQVMDVMGKEVFDELVHLVGTTAGNDIADLSVDEVKTAVSDALSYLTSGSFNIITGALEDVFKDSVKGLVCTTATSMVTTGSDVTQFASVISFMIKEVGGDVLRRRVRKVAQGYWDVFGAGQLWVAALIMNRLTWSVWKAASPSTSEADGALTQKNLSALINSTIELVREGVIACGRRSNDRWRLTAKKAMYWCTEAEASRTGWGSSLDFSPYSFRNQGAWEECRILLDMGENPWPLS